MNKLQTGASMQEISAHLQEPMGTLIFLICENAADIGISLPQKLTKSFRKGLDQDKVKKD